MPLGLAGLLARTRFQATGWSWAFCLLTSNLCAVCYPWARAVHGGPHTRGQEEQHTSHLQIRLLQDQEGISGSTSNPLWMLAVRVFPSYKEQCTKEQRLGVPVDDFHSRTDGTCLITGAYWLAKVVGAFVFVLIALANICLNKVSVSKKTWNQIPTNLLLVYIFE